MITKINLFFSPLENNKCEWDGFADNLGDDFIDDEKDGCYGFGLWDFW